MVGAAALTAALIATTAACSDPASGGSGGKDSVSVVGFSVMKTANKQVIADFEKTTAGKGVTFKQSYGASGDQARAIMAGLKADEAHLSLEPDVTKLTDAEPRRRQLEGHPDQGHPHPVGRRASWCARATRRTSQTWDDLVKPGIKIVTPNPGSSGSAKWNILAAYGHVLAQGGTEADAQAYLKKFLANVAAFPGSGKDATTAFEGGTGDVLLSYENEAIEARQAGADFDYIVPPQTLLIQNPAALDQDRQQRGQGRSWPSS